MLKKTYIILVLLMIVICTPKVGIAFETNSLDSYICDVCSKPLRFYSFENKCMVYEGYYIVVGDFGFALCKDCYEKHKKEIVKWSKIAKKFVKKEQDKIDEQDKANNIQIERKKLNKILTELLKKKKSK